ncbi:DUF202 domain-containing protein [Cupriavidus sp. P-10]|uniref:DUF202 domain-containing protein n=1 Tax=unclassified Cupriavidus TaxID=2640874 RepID=UPI000E2F9CB0|nr:DUF202 domain-containing protein [Cupriavidus sp. P-10]
MKDPGLQPERTALAWSRTGWACLAVAALCIRTVLGENLPGLQVTGLIASSLCLLVFATCFARSRQLREGVVTSYGRPHQLVSLWLSLMALYMVILLVPDVR